MCGFVGHISNFEIDKIRLIDANKYTECRGPDQFKHHFGELTFKKNKKLFYNFLFNRLAIIDLSESASQPMENYLGNKILFNGEIYNHNELKKDLIKKGAEFSSDHSDTEVLLNGLSLEGLSFIDKIIGQFSFAFLDFNQEKLHLVRDRLGQKPMFYYSTSEQFIFGSNLKSVSNLVNDVKLSDNSVKEYLSTGVVAAPNTIFKNFYKLLPGEVLTLDLNDELSNSQKYKYWSIDNFVDNKTFSEKSFFNLLEDSIEKRLESDVALATLLSGGIDSTSISKLQKNFGKEVNTFSVSIENSKYDESKWIKKVNKKYGFNDNTVSIDSVIKNEEIIKSIELFDEPYCDPSTLPSYKISKSISQKFKVAITGDGGDELLGGYTRIYNVINGFKLPSFLVEAIFKVYPPILGSGSNIKRFSKDVFSAYSSYYEDTKLLDILNIKYNDPNLKYRYKKIHNSKYKSLILFDYKYYLPEMMLLKIDRTFMANSVEARSPFVDHRLVEYMISTDYKVDKKENSKYILKQFLYEDFDKSFINRKKMGFVFDIKHWVFSNEEFIKNMIDEKTIIRDLNLQNYKKLFKIKTRTNAIRIWKIFFLSVYLSTLSID